MGKYNIQPGIKNNVCDLTQFPPHEFKTMRQRTFNCQMFHYKFKYCFYKTNLYRINHVTKQVSVVSFEFYFKFLVRYYDICARHECIYKYLYVCMHVCMYVCMYALMYGSMYVCMHVRMHVNYVYMHACTYVCMYVFMYACMHGWMDYALIFKCMYTCM